MITKFEAIKSLVPNAQVSVIGDDVEWLEQPENKPTDAEISAEVERLSAEYERNEYQRKRAAEYPPATDYLDAVVKGDTKQMQAYKDACMAIKAKYPKPQ